MKALELGYHGSLSARSLLGSLGLGAAVLLAAIAAGCGSAVDSAATSGTHASGSGDSEGDEGNESNGTAGGTTPGGGASQGGAADGVPCDVAKVLSAACLSCHGQPLAGGAPISLVTFAELTAVSASHAPATQIERSLARMQDAQSPMPPGQPGAVSASDLALLQAWVDSGTPKGSCGTAGGGAAGGPFASPAKCTSGNMQSPGEGGGMAPGRACMSCHTGAGEEQSGFTVAGTVYPSAHEPNDCQSAGVSGSVVQITDANNQVLTLQVGPSGNFYTGQAVALPYSAKVIFQGRERPMGGKQQSGDCNSCHTQAGAGNAPGRVVIP